MGLKILTEEDLTPIETSIVNKADKATTLEGYGIEDALTVVEEFETNIDNCKNKDVVYKIKQKVELPYQPREPITKGYLFVTDDDIPGDFEPYNYTQIFITHGGIKKRNGTQADMMSPFVWEEWKDIDTNGGSVDLSKYAKTEDLESEITAREQANAELSDAISEIKNGESFEKGAIKPESTSFFEIIYSGNLFNPDDVVSGYITNIGAIGANDKYITTNYIPIKEGQTLRRQFDYGNIRFDNEATSVYGIMRMCAFRADKKTVVEFQQDLKVWTMPPGTEYVRVSMTTAGLSNNISLIISESSQPISFEPFGSVAGAHLKTEYMPGEAIKAFIPKDIYCAVGRTIEIYNNQVCPAANDSLYFKWDCKVGKALKRKFSIEGTESVIGDYALNLTIYNASMDILWSGSSTLHIVEDNISDLSICAIGDSLTNQKAWLPELINLNNGISFVGTRSFSLKDSDNVTRNGSHEGRSGWTAARYNLAGDASPSEASFKYANPFFDGSGFNWSYYVTNSLGGVSPDVVVIFLGTNGITLDPTSNGNAIKLLVDRIRKDNTTIPIFVVNTLYKSNQNGIGKQTDSDGYSTYKGQYKYEEDMKIFNLMVYLNDILSTYENVYTVPVALCHDSEYNYGAVETAVNPRSEITEFYPTESVHPQSAGYYQIADVLYSIICSK